VKFDEKPIVKPSSSMLALIMNEAVCAFAAAGQRATAPANEVS
jgi:hypothetical protein